MYHFLQKKFDIKDDDIEKIISIDQDYRELFDDYEEMHKQVEMYMPENEMHEMQCCLVRELEEEISELIYRFKNENTEKQ
jgi:hypothetical protein